jgi:hypothetical protein
MTGSPEYDVIKQRIDDWHRAAERDRLVLPARRARPRRRPGAAARIALGGALVRMGLRLAGAAAPSPGRRAPAAGGWGRSGS